MAKARNTPRLQPVGKKQKAAPPLGMSMEDWTKLWTDARELSQQIAKESALASIDDARKQLLALLMASAATASAFVMLYQTDQPETLIQVVNTIAEVQVQLMTDAMGRALDQRLQLKEPMSNAGNDSRPGTGDTNPS